LSGNAQSRALYDISLFRLTVKWRTLLSILSFYEWADDFLQADSPYKGGTFYFDVSLPVNYPFKAPTVRRAYLSR